MEPPNCRCSWTIARPACPRPWRLGPRPGDLPRHRARARRHADGRHLTPGRPAHHAATATAGQPLMTHRILVIEDEPAKAANTEDYLRHACYTLDDKTEC